MSLRLMAAMVSGVSNKEDLKKREAEGKSILSELLNLVQVCQTRYGGKSELATEDDVRIVELCEKWRNVLTHGMKTTVPTIISTSTVQDILSAASSFNFTAGPLGLTLWSYTRLHLTKHEEERFTMLKAVNSPMGYFRAFLRAALNERSLERYLHSWVSHGMISEYYEEGACLRDPETNKLLPSMAGGLTSILFAISIDKAELNEVQIQGGPVIRPEPIIPSMTPMKTSTNAKRKPLRQIIDFESEVLGSATSKSISRIIEECETVKNNSAPATCLSSPDPKLVSSKTPATSHSEPSTSKPNDVRQFFPDGYMNERLRNPNSDSPSQLLARLSERAKELFTKSKSLDMSTESVKEETASTSSVANLRMSESDSEDLARTNSIDGSVSCLELCFADDDASPEEHSLQAALMKQQEEYAALQLKLTQIDITQKEKCKKTDRIILDLNRENECLKEQLRKYISAVQMLKQDGTQNDEVQQYESKLIQVAQMHAELMEFNEYLQKRLMEAEDLLAREGKTCTVKEPEIVSNVSIYIPTAFLVGSGSQGHHVYQVFVRVSNDEWNVYHRYAEFRELHMQLKNSHPDIAIFKFPPKKALRKKEAWLVEERRMKLQAYLRHVVLVLPQVRQCGSRRQLVNLLPFLGESCNITTPSSSAEPSSRRSLVRLFSARQPEPPPTPPESAYSGL